MNKSIKRGLHEIKKEVHQKSGPRHKIRTSYPVFATMKGHGGNKVIHPVIENLTQTTKAKPIGYTISE